MVTTLQPAESYICPNCDDVRCRLDNSVCEPAANQTYFCTGYPRHVIVDRVHTPLKPEQ